MKLDYEQSRDKADAARLSDIGGEVLGAIIPQLRPYQIAALIGAALGLGLGDADPTPLADIAPDLAPVIVDGLGRAALGGMLLGLTDALEANGVPAKIEALDDAAQRGAAVGVGLARRPSAPSPEPLTTG